MNTVLLAHGGGGGGTALASWSPFFTTLGIYAAIVVALFVFGRAGGRPGAGAVLHRIPDSLERLTRIPAWAAASAGTALYGVLVAGIGFYSDVSWHVALGRDETLFTAPHASIAAGLVMIFGAAVLGVFFATLQRVPTGFRLGSVRVPWSMLPLGALGLAAVSGFPIDEFWHRQYGIDVTMWSPSHMLMILGASFTPIAAWVALAEAGVPVKGWGRAAHVLAAWLSLEGLAASQGEFAFGVPQYQALFLPVLISVAGGFALVATRIVLGRWWLLGIATFGLLWRFGPEIGPEGPIDTRTAGIYVGSAVLIELIAYVWSPENRVRFAVAAGLAVGTLGLATEWLWNQTNFQPWQTSLLPDAALLGLLAALGSAILAAAYTEAFTDRGGRIPRVLVAAAAVAVLFSLAWPMPRRVGEVTADMRVIPAGAEDAFVELRLTPRDAADEARWFQALSWQGGDAHVVEMVEVRPGVYRSEAPVETSGRAKSIIRLHRGAEMMSVPVYFPDDPEIGEPAIPAENRTMEFSSEPEFMMREAKPGSPWFKNVVYGSLLGAAVIWAATFAIAVSRIASSRARTGVTVVPRDRVAA